MQWWTADGQKGEDYVTDTFTYVNDQPASLSWYHDHTMGSTRFKPYLGLAAAYLIFDKVDNGTTINGQKVPDRLRQVPPAARASRTSSSTPTAPCSIRRAEAAAAATHPIWVPEFFADTPVVNGKAYPFLNAEPRRYRLRLLNGSQARFYDLQLKVGETPAAGVPTLARSLPLWVIGSEGGLLPAPAKMDQPRDRPRRALRRDRGLHGPAAGQHRHDDQRRHRSRIRTARRRSAVPELMKINVNQPLLGTDTTACCPPT